MHPFQCPQANGTPCLCHSVDRHFTESYTTFAVEIKPEWAEHFPVVAVGYKSLKTSDAQCPLIYFRTDYL